MQTDMKLEKISVNPTNKYIYGIKMSEEGGSDIFKFDMRKWWLDKRLLIVKKRKGQANDLLNLVGLIYIILLLNFIKMNCGKDFLIEGKLDINNL